MAHRRSSRKQINTALHNDRKGTQRTRLLAGMVAATTREGYAGANVSAVIREAGVSRPTFYDYFEDRDDCFAASLLDAHQALLGEVRKAVDEGPPESALARAVEAMVCFAASQPALAQFLMKEALGGGPGALDARDRGVREIARAVEQACARVPERTPLPDAPASAVVGAVQRLLASRLRRGERDLGDLQDDLIAWVESYAAPAGSRRWATLEPRALPGRSPFLPAATLRAPCALPPGRPRISEEAVAENHRQRIMFATSQVVKEHGYNDARISQITQLAGVDGRSFYRLFADKQEAFSAIHEIGFQFLMAATAAAFFAGASWPERIWEALRAATQSIDETPTFAHIGFVEAYAVGPQGLQRVEDSRVAFTIFLQEGFRHQQIGQPPSRAALEAIVTTMFEIVYLETRASSAPQTAGTLADIAHICLTPFMGAEATNEFIAGKLGENAGDAATPLAALAASCATRAAQ